jgi:putative hydrolase of HD superfamily
MSQPPRYPMTILRTPRLELRPWTPADVPALVRLADNWNVSRQLRDRVPFPYTEADARQWVGRCAAAGEPTTVFAVALAPGAAVAESAGSPGEAIGGIGLERHGDVHRCVVEVGYWLGEPYWGHGFAAEAVRAVVGHAFAAFPDVTVVQAQPFAGNVASQRVLEKCGFRLDGRLRAAAVKAGELTDVLVYSLLREEAEAAGMLATATAADTQREATADRQAEAVARVAAGTASEPDAAAERPERMPGLTPGGDAARNESPRRPVGAAEVARVFAFALELDRLKAVIRRTRPAGLERYENSAEHSWQVALVALLLAPWSPVPVDLQRVVEMLLVHDVPEIDCGDTFVYARDAVATAAAEEAAAIRLFGLLPRAAAERLLLRWREFEHGDSPEARLARAADRLMPVLQNVHADGRGWRENGIRGEQVKAVNGGRIAAVVPEVWAVLEPLIDAVFAAERES